jgi:hypothetical protein
MAKITGKRGPRFECSARVCHGAEAALTAILNGNVITRSVDIAFLSNAPTTYSFCPSAHTKYFHKYSFV